MSQPLQSWVSVLFTLVQRWISELTEIILPPTAQKYTDAAIYSHTYQIFFSELIIKSIHPLYLIGVFYFAETVHTAQAKPCVSAWKTPYPGRCLRSLFRQPLEVRSSQEKRKHNSKNRRILMTRYRDAKYVHELALHINMLEMNMYLSFRIKAFRKNVLAKCVSTVLFFSTDKCCGSGIQTQSWTKVCVGSMEVT